MPFKGNTSLVLDERSSTLTISTKSVKDLCHNEDFELKSPELRDSEEIGLFITCAGHPTNFIFQAAKYESDLQHLEAAMSEFYNNEEIEELAEHKIVKNKVYAACDMDHIWHRVVVTDSIVSSRVPVRFCDYGEVILAPISSLRELNPEFIKTPFMAIKGQLAGVRPLVENWSMDDCLRFCDLVEDQFLAGTIVGILDNKVNPMERTVFLNLIDGSMVHFSSERLQLATPMSTTDLTTLEPVGGSVASEYCVAFNVFDVKMSSQRAKANHFHLKDIESAKNSTLSNVILMENNTNFISRLFMNVY